MNVLLNIIAECEHLKEKPDTALVKLMMACEFDFGPQCILLAVAWHEANGEPTYPKLKAWAEKLYADPDNSALVERFAEAHHQHMALLTPEEREELATYLRNDRP